MWYTADHNQKQHKMQYFDDWVEKERIWYSFDYIVVESNQINRIAFLFRTDKRNLWFRSINQNSYKSFYITHSSYRSI